MTAGPGPDASDAKQGFDQAYRELIDSERFQTELGRFDPPPPRPRQNWGFLDWLASLGSFWEILFWIVAVSAAAALIFFIARALIRWRSDRIAADSEPEDVDWRPEAAQAHGLLDDADALADEGRFAEAARLLLHRSVADIERRLPDFLRPALTSRDIAGSESLPAPARGSFAEIAQIVERGIFASRPIDEEGWREARAAYETFAFGKSWA